MSALRFAAATAAVVVACAAAGSAQAPHHDWRTAETEGFRIHYPADLEEWALRTARRLDVIRAALADAVSFAPRQTVDVIVMDPAAEPNGFAIPLLGSPRMVLWASPPPSDSVIGQFRSWPELLAIHEDAHLVHLLRPSRNPVSRALERTVLPLGPIALRAPRWVTEGYATMLEGQLTGSGRPYSDLRAAILRRWSQLGRLPPYERLAADEDRWQGMSMAYLAGSAFLEWLQERRGPDSLRHLWARLTARTSRSFSGAFEGVFGAAPEELYGRFQAEVTERAMALERARAPHIHDGDLWQRLEWTTGVPALSRDGGRIAIVLRQRDRPARLVVWSTEEDPDRERKWSRRIERVLERDPQDVAPVRERPLPREPLHELPAIDGADPRAPRWMPDGESILFIRAEADADGSIHPDLFRWHLAARTVERITRLADVRQADPHPDGRSAVAVRQRRGLSQLVRIDLSTGSVAPLGEPSLDTVHDTPRVSPDGRHVAYLRHSGASWRLVIRSLEDGAERELDAAGSTITHPAWSADGSTVFVSLGRDGFIDIHAWPLDGGAPVAVTRTHGAALGGAPSPDGLLYFLSLEPHGLDLRRVRVAPLRPADGILRAPFVPAVPPIAQADPPRPGAREIAAGGPYGVGRQEFMPIAGGLFGPSARALEIGLRGGDVVGRLSYLGVVSLARQEAGTEGAAFAAALRRWPIAPRAHLFTLDERRPPIAGQNVGEAPFGAQWRGAEMGADWRWRRGLRYTGDVAAGGIVAQLEPDAAVARPLRVAFLAAGVQARPSRGPWHARYAGRLRLDAGRTGDDEWRRIGVMAQAGAGYARSSLLFTYDRRDVNGMPSRFDLLQAGGVLGTVAPPAFASGRIDVPALPAAALAGERYERQRLDVRAVVRLPVFLERHRVWNRGGTPGEWLRIVGTEVSFATGPIPLVRLPAPALRVGAARVLDAPFRGEHRVWASLSWRP